MRLVPRVRKPSSVPLASLPTSGDDHSSGAVVADCLICYLPGDVRWATLLRRFERMQCPDTRYCSGWGLPCRQRRRRRGELLPHLFTLTLWQANARYLFCGTFLEVSLTGCYPAPCPLELGLSSRITRAIIKTRRTPPLYPQLARLSTAGANPRSFSVASGAFAVAGACSRGWCDRGVSARGIGATAAAQRCKRTGTDRKGMACIISRVVSRRAVWAFREACRTGERMGYGKPVQGRKRASRRACKVGLFGDSGMNGSSLPSVCQRTLDRVPERVLALLMGIGSIAPVRAGLIQRGYTQQDHDYAFSRLARLTYLPVDMMGTDTGATRQAVAMLDAWDEPHMAAIHATLRRLHPAQDAFVFDQLAPSQGAFAVLGVARLLDRLDALETGQGRDPSTRDADLAAIKTLENRGYTKAERQRLRELVAQATQIKPVAPDSSSERNKILAELYYWYHDWAAQVRLVTTNRSHLIRLGLVRRRSRSAAADPSSHAR